LSTRVFLVGTDTNAGKTTVACALLRSAARAGISVVPFKPAESGPEGPSSDHARLLAASILSAKERDELAPLRWPTPLAPGMADDPSPFLGRGVSTSDLETMLGRARWALARLEQRHAAQLTLIEGAGGLLVPMPGGSWLPEWITGLRARPLIVARAGLGTINHTLLTIESLRVRELEPVGFLFTQLLPRDDPSRSHNATVIEQRSGVPCLGSLPFLGRPPSFPEDDDWLIPDFWPRMLAASERPGSP
jgi:dethiobiotin synthetase